MARPLRITPPGIPFHVLNRGNERRPLFRNPREYDAFLGRLETVRTRSPIDWLAYCLMPNHWHLVVVGKTERAISDALQWVSGGHASDLRRQEGTVGQGHVYQSRFHGFPIGSSHHLRNVIRYVEANARRAALVELAEDWRWNSLWDRPRSSTAVLSPLPVDLPDNWPDIVNTALSPRLRRRLVESVQDSRPYGPARWVKKISSQLQAEETAPDS
jgi:putative transposase